MIENRFMEDPPPKKLLIRKAPSEVKKETKIADIALNQ